MPYLVKGTFVPHINEMLNLSKYAHEGEGHPDLPKFKQTQDNYRMERIDPGEPITRKNPLAHVQKIKECNSFQMSTKAASQTIRTLM